MFCRLYTLAVLALAVCAPAQAQQSSGPFTGTHNLSPVSEPVPHYEAPSDFVVFPAFFTSVAAGAAGGYAAYRFLPRSDDPSLLPYIGTGILTGTLANTAAVYAFGDWQGDPILMTGAALLSQVAVYGTVYLLAKLDNGLEEFFAWMSPAVVFGASLAATSASDYVGYRTLDR
jgi:hypothetical protein